MDGLAADPSLERLIKGEIIQRKEEGVDVSSVKKLLSKLIEEEPSNKTQQLTSLWGKLESLPKNPRPLRPACRPDNLPSEALQGRELGVSQHTPGPVRGLLGEDAEGEASRGLTQQAQKGHHPVYDATEDDRQEYL